MSLPFNEIDELQAFRGNGTTARDKRARNGLERKRRNQVDNGKTIFIGNIINQ